MRRNLFSLPNGIAHFRAFSLECFPVAFSDWIEGARLRTLPAALAPVLAGTAIAVGEGKASVPRALLAAVLALSLQVGVNYANDYSDGIRGTDDHRTGPARLTGGGKAQPSTVKYAAFACFAVGALTGLILVVLSGHLWLIAVGIAAILSAWYYTGGKKPYGYMGLGEVFVFLFFGVVATAGTTYTQADSVPFLSWVSSCAIGCLACAILMVNNIRDIPTDKKTGKNTLAVRLGDHRSRLAFTSLIILPLISLVFFLPLLGAWVTLVFVPSAFFAYGAILPVLSGAQGRELIAVLRASGIVELTWGALLLVAYLLAT